MATTAARPTGRGGDRDGSWAEYYARIDAILDEDRPARALPSETAWMERARGFARNHIPNESEIVRHFGDDITSRREGLATKAANKILRLWMNGQAPLDWGIDGSKPIKLKDGTRVRLDCATSDDLRNAARALAGRLRITYDNGMVAARGMWLLATEATRRGYATASDIGDQEPGAGASWDVDYSDLDWSDGYDDEDD